MKTFLYIELTAKKYIFINDIANNYSKNEDWKIANLLEELEALLYEYEDNELYLECIDIEIELLHEYLYLIENSPNYDTNNTTVKILKQNYKPSFKRVREALKELDNEFKYIDSLIVTPT
jgi:hypothetical protein